MIWRWFPMRGLFRLRSSFVRIWMKKLSQLKWVLPRLRLFWHFSRVALLLSMLVCMLSGWVPTPCLISRWFKLPLQANRNKLLDVARETYKENVGDIYQLNKTLADQYELPLTLMYQDSGFVFVLKKTASDRELPRGFINVSSRKGKWLFSSIELVRILLGSPAGLHNERSLQKKLNARMKDALDEALILSEKWVFPFPSSLS